MSHESSLRISDVRSDAGVTVRLAGELDLSTVEPFRAALGGQLVAGRSVAVDLAELTFCDSTGLGAMVALHRTAREVGAGLAWYAPGRRILGLLKMTGLDQVLPVFATREAAWSELAKQS